MGVIMKTMRLVHRTNLLCGPKQAYAAWRTSLPPTLLQGWHDAWPCDLAAQPRVPEQRNLKEQLFPK